ncbi:MAG: 3-mercaptopyruvate sulfurtransferase [Caulobacteraceae bacterium]|nr:3-mercaptopyruvate sulfurtransferase [Caulobacteraceae bacterium]
MDRDPFVSTEWLAAHLEAPDLVLIDATWFMPGTPRDASAEYAERHIPGAVHFDIDEIADHSTDLPHMLPEPADFAIHARRLGVEPTSRVVVYDAQGLFSAPRVWWMFRAMGHENVAVLEGGLARWIAEARPVEAGWIQKPHGEFKAHPDPDLVRRLDQVREALDGGGAQVLDARAADRFSGRAPEPRPGLRSGHMPGALNLPWQTIVTAEGVLAPKAELERLFKAAGVDLDKPIVTTCGSGVSAAILAIGLARLGHWRTPVYDGSWSEWGARSDTQVATGEAARV